EPGTDLSQGLLAAVQELLRRKAACGEKELKPQLPVISEFIKTECSRLKEAAASAPQDSRCDFAELNAVFRHALMQAHT
ncbi:nucleotidyltransferase domain-containing protein, partial [bacterium]|nr:nucleotidyltransferase domain-containing protein [bacterium]